MSLCYSEMRMVLQKDLEEIKTQNFFGVDYTYNKITEMREMLNQLERENTARSNKLNELYVSLDCSSISTEDERILICALIRSCECFGDDEINTTGKEHDLLHMHTYLVTSTTYKTEYYFNREWMTMNRLETLQEIIAYIKDQHKKNGLDADTLVTIKCPFESE
jgi:hypothetical protein